MPLQRQALALACTLLPSMTRRGLHREQPHAQKNARAIPGHVSTPPCAPFNLPWCNISVTWLEGCETGDAFHAVTTPTKEQCQF
ncbi:hypothetical protein BT63DRAFT_62637 [Microthyrium microscopicum]|uniref:Uncharacterized protein n=1 Tax=Microthyrium microscopicum TaxID=703497 RepID=A0A6A6U130_9PEZI|nr:hypothetical protein BT63DRAFT_62637 [Microthyrium microscopicum]